MNPATGGPWAEIADVDANDVSAGADVANGALRAAEWRSLSPTRRGRLLMRLADLVAEHAERLAAIESRDNGKLYREMSAQLCTVPEWL